MVRTTDRPSAATQRSSRAKGNSAPNEKGQHGEHDRVDYDAEGRDQSLKIQPNGHDQLDDDNHDASEKRERGATRHSNDSDERGFGSSRDSRDSDERGFGSTRDSRDSDERGFGSTRDSRDSDERGATRHSNDSDERGFGSSRDSRDSDAADVFAPVLGAWKQMYASWFQLAEDVAKSQQQAFAQLLGGAAIRPEGITEGDRRGRELALKVSRASSAPAGRIE